MDQPGCLSGPLSAHLRCGWNPAVVFVAKAAQETIVDIYTFYGNLFCLGVCHQCAVRMDVGRALVGLQRAFYECERANLPVGSSMFRAGRNAAQLLFAALVYEVVPQDFPQVETDSLRDMSDCLYFGHNLLCGETPYGLWDSRVKIKII